MWSKSNYRKIFNLYHDFSQECIISGNDTWSLLISCPNFRNNLAKKVLIKLCHLGEFILYLSLPSKYQVNLHINLRHNHFFLIACIQFDMVKYVFYNFRENSNIYSLRADRRSLVSVAFCGQICKFIQPVFWQVAYKQGAKYHN